MPVIELGDYQEGRASLSTAVFPKGRAPVCLFCGVGPQWFGVSKDNPGCGCSLAVKVREGKAKFQLISRNSASTGSGLVVTRCSPELWGPLISTGILVGGLKAVLGKELPEESRAAMREAGAAWKAAHETVTAEPARAAESVTPSSAGAESVTGSVTAEKGFGETVTPEVRVCSVCGKPMPEGLRPQARFCSGACRVKASRRKR